MNVSHNPHRQLSTAVPERSAEQVVPLCGRTCFPRRDHSQAQVDCDVPVPRRRCWPSSPSTWRTAASCCVGGYSPQSCFPRQAAIHSDLWSSMRTRTCGTDANANSGHLPRLDSPCRRSRPSSRPVVKHIPGRPRRVHSVSIGTVTRLLNNRNAVKVWGGYQRPHA